MEFSGGLWTSSEILRLAMPAPVSTYHLSALPYQGPTRELCKAHVGIGQGTSECVFFLAQVNELPSSTVHRGKLEAKENAQTRPLTAPREAKKTRRKQPSAPMSKKYEGYEELLTAKPDPTFVEPKGMSGPGTSCQPRAGHARPRLMLTPCECLPEGS